MNQAIRTIYGASRGACESLWRLLKERLLQPLCVVICFNLYFSPLQASDSMTVVKHLEQSYSKALRPYLYDVLRLTLELTQDDFGPYIIKVNQGVLSAARAKIETEKGHTLNVLFSTGWEGDLVNEENVTGYEFIAFNDLLGLRGLITLPTNNIIKEPPKTRAEFLTYTAGQGFFWEDVVILKSAGIPVIEAQVFDALFPMVDKQRFSYIPLSVLEIPRVLRSRARQYPLLTSHPTLNIYYPMNFKLYVNNQDALLVKRIGVGLERAKGEPLLKIFNKHFPLIVWDEQVKKNLFIIQNPKLAAQENAQIINRFVNQFGRYFTILK